MSVPSSARAAVLPLAAALVAALVASLALAACRDESRADRSSGPEQDLLGLPGVASAEVAEVLVEQDTPGTAVVVDVDSDVTDRELADVLGRIDGLAPDEWTVTLDCGPAGREDAGDREGCDTATGTATASDIGSPEQGARALLAAARRFPTATVTVTARRTVVIDLADPGPEPVTRALTAVLADPDLKTTGDLTIGAGPRAEGPRFLVTTEAPLTQSTLTLWRRLAPTLNRLPATTPGAVALAVDAESEVTVSAQVQLPGVVPPEKMTPARRGTALWPVLRAQLDVVAGLPAGTQYAARNLYRPVAGARPHGNDPFLAITIGRPARPDDLGRTWSVDAAHYLAS